MEVLCQTSKLITGIGNPTDKLVDKWTISKFEKVTGAHKWKEQRYILEICCKNFKLARQQGDL